MKTLYSQTPVYPWFGQGGHEFNIHLQPSTQLHREPLALTVLVFDAALVVAVAAGLRFELNVPQLQHGRHQLQHRLHLVLHEPHDLHGILGWESATAGGTAVSESWIFTLT